jgi:hypothetical protein
MRQRNALFSQAQIFFGARHELWEEVESEESTQCSGLWFTTLGMELPKAGDSYNGVQIRWFDVSE